MDWNEGYRTDIPYTFGYYGEMNPANIRLCILLAGLVPPKFETACELGYGQGVGLNIHAAAEFTEWHGTDFNPVQVVGAREMAQYSGAHVYGDSFRDFCENPNLPQFDYIALHGIWSWISPKNRAEIIHFIDKKLVPGGALYISYNTNPGRAYMKPVRDLLKLHDEIMGAPGDSITDRVAQSIKFLEDLLAAEPEFARHNPDFAGLLEGFKKHDKTYLAHEYLDGHWILDSFADMEKALGEARMGYACSASVMDSMADMAMKPAQRQFLGKLSNPTLRQSARDFMRNTMFRKDIWIKGPKRNGPISHNQALRQVRFLLLDPQKLTAEIDLPGGNARISQNVLDALKLAFADADNRSIGEIEKMARDAHVDAQTPLILQALCFFLANGTVALVQPDGGDSRLVAKADRFNGFLETRAREAADINVLASPMTGGGERVNRYEQLFLLAIRSGAKDAAGMARFALESTKAAGHYFIHEGQRADDAVAMKNLETMAWEFIAKRLPVLRCLKIS